MATTFEALGRDEGALKETISKAPPTMDVAIESFRAQRPFLANLEGFGEDFAPATEELRGALPTLNRAIDKAVPVQRRAPELNEELGKTLVQLRELAAAPGTLPGVRGLGATVKTLNPQLRFYGPFVTVCNSPNYFFTYLAEHFSEPDTTGSAQRALLNSTGHQDDSQGSMGADEPANGEGVLRGNAQFAQNQPYAAAITPDGRADCETGQRGWLERNAGGLDSKYRVNLNPRTPGAQGPTFTGAAARARGPDLHRRARDRATSPASRRPRQGARSEGRQAPQARPRTPGSALLALAGPDPARLPRLHEVDPVPPALRDQGRLRVLEQPQEGARRCGSRASRSAA